ncbi:MAG: DUF411 domain-containing protein [Rhodothermales bacterium]|nr:DUF411 domain-containing protein [Rhodothermales bacterium]
MSTRTIIAGAVLLLGLVGYLAIGLPSSATASNTMIVYKSPTCGCCGAWIEYMEEAGFDIEVRDMQNVTPIKEQEGVYPRLRSCHTATIGGYVLEGHVPAEQVTRMLAEQPNIRGIAVPGMPIGSPGMEQGDPANYDDYQVVAFTNDGELTVYADIKAGS